LAEAKKKAISATITALQEMAKRVALLRPDTIILVSPHTTIYSDYFHLSPGSGAKGSFAAFSAPQVRIQVNYDAELRQQIIEEAQKEGSRPVLKEGRMPHWTMAP
jgi:aromatic ring-opening dioxygenase LigB subunit